MDYPTISVYEDGNKIELKTSKSIKILGIYIDSNMTWDEQIKKLQSKTIGTVKHLHRVNKLLPMRAKLQLYDSLVASHLNYADIIWSGCNETNKKKLQNVQNFALKSILGMKKYDSATDALKILKYLNLEEKRNIHEAVFAHKALTSKMPTLITTEYLNLLSYEDHRSAMKGNLQIPRHKKNLYKSSVLYRTVNAWNNTSPTIRTEDAGKFKRELQKNMVTKKFAK